MKHRNLLFSLCVLAAVLAVTASMYFFITRRINRAPIPDCVRRPAVALTFDDGPDPRFTPQILDILYSHGARSTFFLVGEKLEANSLLVQEMAACGHEIGCHTYSHRDLSRLSCRETARQIQDMQRRLENILPGYDMKYFRPPYGRYRKNTEKAAGLTMALWTVDSTDWQGSDSSDIAQAVTRNVKDGDVIVFHDNNRQTVRALDEILTRLEERGFSFATLSQLWED